MSIRKQMPNGKCHHLKSSCISEVVFRVVFLSGIPQSCFEGIHLLCASNIRGAFMIIKIMYIRLNYLCVTPVLCDRTCHLWWRGGGHPSRDRNPSGVLRSRGRFSIQVVYFLGFTNEKFFGNGTDFNNSGNLAFSESAWRNNKEKPS